MLEPSLRRIVFVSMIVAMLAGCGESEGGPPATSVASYPAMPRTVFGGDRPVTIQVPTTYSTERSVPLLVVLHGYAADGLLQEQFLGLGRLLESQGILIVAPDGTVDSGGHHFWNATPACCDLGGSGVDDVAYLRGLISDIRQDYNVDPKRIYLVGHSNGGFMAHRMACEAARDIAAIVSLAGATFQNPADCRPSEPVSVLDIHGDADDTVLYEGAQIGGIGYPSELETVMHWQQYDHCSPELETESSTLDLDYRLPGNETTVQRFKNCAADTDVELWTIQGGSHIPNISHSFPLDVWQWLSDHPKH